MLIPPILDSWLSVMLYLLLLFILIKGIWQFIEKQYNPDSKFRSLVPIGAIATILGIIGYIRGYSLAFEAIEAAGDISPSIVASGLGQSGAYPVLGLVSLAMAYLFKYIND